MLEFAQNVKTLNDTERLMFQNEFQQRSKNIVLGQLLSLFLGGIGVHHFYLGRNYIGAVYFLFCWTFIPAAFGFVEVLLMRSRVNQYNSNLSKKIVTQLTSMRSEKVG